MSEHLEKYVAALREFEKSQDKARACIKLITAVTESINYHLVEFAVVNYGLLFSRKQHSHSHRLNYDMSSWPNATELRMCFHAWHAAWESLWAAWNNVPPEDRGALKAPPEHLTAT